MKYGLFRLAMVPRSQRPACLILPELLRRGAEVSELVDSHSIRLKAERLVRPRFQTHHKIFVCYAHCEVGQVFLPARLGNERFYPANGLGIGLGPNESLRSPASC